MFLNVEQKNISINRPMPQNAYTQERQHQIAAIITNNVDLFENEMM